VALYQVSYLYLNFGPYILFCFYRATLCVSAVFAVVRCQLSVCLFVCPSVTLVGCIHTAADIVKLLVRLGSPIDLVFHSQVSNSKENPFSGSTKYTGLGKFCDFRLKSPFISEMVRDSAVIAMER